MPQAKRGAVDTGSHPVRLTWAAVSALAEPLPWEDRYRTSLSPLLSREDTQKGWTCRKAYSPVSLLETPRFCSWRLWKPGNSVLPLTTSAAQQPADFSFCLCPHVSPTSELPWTSCSHCSASPGHWAAPVLCPLSTE